MASFIYKWLSSHDDGNYIHHERPQSRVDHRTPDSHETPDSKTSESSPISLDRPVKSCAVNKIVILYSKTLSSQSAAAVHQWSIATNPPSPSSSYSDVCLSDKYGLCEETLGKGAHATVILAHCKSSEMPEKLYAVKVSHRC